MCRFAPPRYVVIFSPTAKEASAQVRAAREYMVIFVVVFCRYRRTDANAPTATFRGGEGTKWRVRSFSVLRCCFPSTLRDTKIRVVPVAAAAFGVAVLTLYTFFCVRTTTLPRRQPAISIFATRAQDSDAKDFYVSDKFLQRSMRSDVVRCLHKASYSFWEVA